MTTATQITARGFDKLWLVTGKDQLVACERAADCARVKDLTSALVTKTGKGFKVRGDARGAARWILKQFCGVDTDQFALAPQGLAHKIWLKNH